MSAAEFEILHKRQSVAFFRLFRLISPLSYLVLLCLTYSLCFISNPLNWHADILIDSRYAQVFALYIFSFTIFYLAFTYIRLGPRSDGESEAPIITSRLYIISVIVAFFCLARLVKLGAIPVISDLGARYSGDSMGGFIDYTCTLATPLSWCLFYFSFVKRISTSKIASILLAILFVLQIAYFRRQDIFEMILGCATLAAWNSRLNFRKLIVISLSTICLIYVVIGVLGVARAGAQNISQEVTGFSLPLFVIIGDLTGAIKFGHYVADLVGPAGLGGIYSFGIFSAVIGEDTLHGAAYLQKNYTSSATAQSINAPLSYYTDFGMYGVFIFGALYGSITSFLWRRAGRMDRHSQWRIIYLMVLIKLMWSIRSGVFLLDPQLIYSSLMVLFLNGGEGMYNYKNVVKLLLSTLFLISICVTALFLVVRFV